MRHILFGVIRRTSLNLDLDLVADARELLGTKTTTETVHQALREVVRQDRLRRLAEWRFDHFTPEELAQLRRWRVADWIDEP